MVNNSLITKFGISKVSPTRCESICHNGNSGQCAFYRAVKACKHDPTHVETTALLVFLSCVKVECLCLYASVKSCSTIKGAINQSHKRREHVYREGVEKRANWPLANDTFNTKF